MKRYNAIIIDDELHVRQALAIMLHEYCPSVNICGQAASAEEGRALLRSHELELIFLDIAMPVEDGFDFVNSIEKEQYAIIFVTAYQQFALKALKANAIDYLLKPVDGFELQEAVDRAIHYHELRRNKAEARHIYTESLQNLGKQIDDPYKPIEKITVSEQFGFRIVQVKEIMYLQADSNYTILHLSGLNKIVATRTLGEFEKLLDNPMFYRIHKSTIINMNFLKAYSSYQGNFAELSDGTRLSISRRKLNEFRDLVHQFAKAID
jgi:two-component system, LytTR family, response regulator